MPGVIVVDETYRNIPCSRRAADINMNRNRRAIARNKADRISADFYALAKTIVSNDVKQFKNQHPEYAVDAGSEIQLSLSLLGNKPLWKERYQKFIEEMVYDNTPAIAYEKAIDVLERISARVIDTLSQ